MNWHSNPIEIDETPDHDDTRRLCGCGDARCWLVEDDPTNVVVRGQVYAADCVGLCTFCGVVDDLAQLIRVSGSWLSHEKCASEANNVTEGRMEALIADERRGK